MKYDPVYEIHPENPNYKRTQYPDEHPAKFWHYRPDIPDEGEWDELGLICDCGCLDFGIKFGYYAVQAECRECGHKEEVYSG